MSRPASQRGEPALRALALVCDRGRQVAVVLALVLVDGTVVRGTAPDRENRVPQCVGVAGHATAAAVSAVA